MGRAAKGGGREGGLAGDVCDHLPHGLHVYQLERAASGPALRLIYANPAAAAITGISPAPALGRTLDEIFPRLPEGLLPRLCAAVDSPGAPVEWEDPGDAGEGATAAGYAARAFPLPHERVGIAFAAGAAAGRRLTRSEERYRSIVESTTDYIYVVQVEDGRPQRTIHGRGCAVVTGYTTEDYDADADLWYRMIHEDDRPTVLRNVELVLSGEHPPPFPHRIRHKDGGTRWVGVTLVPRFDEQRRVFAYDGLIRDITQRKLAEDATIESERYLQSILDAMNVGVLIVDPETRTVTDANRCALEMIGARREEVLGRRCPGLLCAAAEDACPVAGGGALEVAECRLLSRSGKEIPVLKSVREIERHGKKVLIESFLNIEERKAGEKERENLIAELRQALSKVKLLSGFLPICASCKKIRDDKGYWNQIESYLRDHSEAEFSHGLCPECARRLYPGYFKE